jgi:uncharacterized protein YjbI with pentapeptide repeats
MSFFAMYAIVGPNSRLAVATTRAGNSLAYDPQPSRCKRTRSEVFVMSKFSLGGDPLAEQGRIGETELSGLIAAHAQWLSSDGSAGTKFDMAGANLIYGGFLEQDMSHASLNGACLRNANLRESKFSNASLLNANLESASMVNIQLDGALLAGASLNRAVSPGATFIRADLTNTKLRSTNLLSANFSHADLSGADLTDANLAGALLPASILNRAILTDAKLMLVDLSDASLREAVLTRAVLFGAILERADLSGADLSDALGLTEPQLASAYGDGRTRLPAEFTGFVMTPKSAV